MTARSRSIPFWLLVVGGASLGFVFLVSLASLGTRERETRGEPRGGRVGAPPPASSPPAAGRPRAPLAPRPLREEADGGRSGGAPGGAPPSGGEPAVVLGPLDLRAVLAAYDGHDRAALEALTAGRERADDPDARIARGLLHDLRDQYAQAFEDLRGLDEQTGGRAARAEARAAFLTAHYDACRAAAAKLPEAEGRRWRLLCDGPFRAAHPLAAAALEARTDAGRYRVVTDLGLAPGALDALEAKLVAAKSEAERGKLVERARKAHRGLDEVGDVMDKAAKAYDRLFSEEAPPVVPTVYVFDARPDFDAFAAELGAGSTENILGFYQPDQRVLVFFDQGRQGERSSSGGVLSQATLEVLLHETFHQWLDLFLDRPPPWFNEGLAELFGIGRITPQGLRYGLIPTQHPSRLDNIRSALGGTAPVAPLPLADLLQADQAEFMRPSQAAVNYAHAWSFVHYLQSSRGGMKVLRDLFHALRDGVPAPAAYREVFGKLDLVGLEREWRQHVGEMR